jgi:hypothetical protein
LRDTFLKHEIPKTLGRWGAPLAITVFFWVTASNDVTVLQMAAALFLISVPWYSYVTWKRREQSDLPIFAMLSFMYMIYYVVPLFWEPHEISEFNAQTGRALPANAITTALIMVVVGISSLWLGMRSHLGRRLVPRHLSIEAPQSRRNYVRAVLALGCLSNSFETSTYALGEGGRQLITLLLTVAPMVAFAIVFRSYLRGYSTRVDRVLMLAFIGSRLLNGLSSGWLGVSASMILICGVIYIAERRRLPRMAPALVVLFILFFQVGKEDFRKAYWQEGSQGIADATAQGGKIERTSFWIQRSLEKWNEVLNDASGQTLKAAILPSVSRVSLLNQTANVVEMTPLVVPYQYGHLYSYLGVTLIPRFVWPEKPSMSEANQFYQVAYGLTSPDDLAATSIGVGFLAEAYISFSWPGVIGIMFLLGIFFDFYQNLFFARNSGILLGSIGVVLLPLMLSIEAQMAAYLGGVIQQILLMLIVFLPAIRIKWQVRQPASRRNQFDSRAKELWT